MKLSYNEWLPFTEYQKEECDIKLKDGTIILHCWPNAGFFTVLCANGIRYWEGDVAEIRYRSYYMEDLCSGDCNSLKHLDKPKNTSVVVMSSPSTKEIAQHVADMHGIIVVGDIKSSFPPKKEIITPRNLPYNSNQADTHSGPHHYILRELTGKWTYKCGKEL